MKESSRAPFGVTDCALTIISLGKSAQNLRELRDHMAAVPAESLAHHFYDSLLRPTFDDPVFRNDFAQWAQRQLHDSLLAERLGTVDPMDFKDLEELRLHLLDVIEDRLSQVSQVPQAAVGHEFHFLRSQFVILDTGIRAATPQELGARIPSLCTGSIFFHFIEAQRRPPVHQDDFSAWLGAWGPDWAPVCERLRQIDIYLWSLPELRDRIASCFADVTRKVMA